MIQSGLSNEAAAHTAFDQVMGAAMSMTRDVELAAAVVAHVRGPAAGGVHASVADRLRSLASAALPGLDDLDEGQRQTVAGVLTSIFRQAADLLEHPEREPGWTFLDPVVLQATGKASMSVAGVLAQIAPRLAGLSERLEAGGAFCDVGTGTGWLAIAAARSWPSASITGIDIFEPALRLAASNLADVGLTNRVTLRQCDVCDLADDEFDFVWLPGPFLAEDIVSRALSASHRSLRSGGWVAFGIYGGPPDPLAGSLAELRTIRSGGHPWTAAAATERLADAQFADVAEIDRTWSAPVRLVVGRRR